MLNDLLYDYTINQKYLEKVLSRRKRISNGDYFFYAHSDYQKEWGDLLNYKLADETFSEFYLINSLFAGCNSFWGHTDVLIEFDNIVVDHMDFMDIYYPNYSIEDEYIKIHIKNRESQMKYSEMIDSDLYDIGKLINQFVLYFKNHDLDFYNIPGKDRFLKKFKETKDLMWLVFYIKRLDYSRYVSNKKDDGSFEKVIGDV